MMTTEHYTDLCGLLVKVQRGLVEDFGFCVSWNGEHLFFESVEQYDSYVKDLLQQFQDEKALDVDMTPEEALEVMLND